ncbi:MAG TPA: phosphotransferase [Terriglobales bacterium]|nr:phosphotransferase [Terriglobales bacterium]
MKLLLVEDDQNFLEVIRVTIRDVLQEREITVCKSRDAAFEAIGANIFDFAVLDLKIPASDGSITAEIEHGRAVYQHLRANSPGTPICWLTAFGTEDFIADLLNEADRADIWGSGNPSPLVRMLPKKRVNELTALVKEVSTEIAALEDVEVISELGLTALDNRVLRIHGRRNQSGSLVVNELSGGFSDIRVLKVIGRDRKGIENFVCAARLGSQDVIHKEIENYKRDVTRLPNGTFSVLTGEVFYGAGPFAGVFYRLIPVFRSFFAVLEDDPKQAVKIVNRLREIQAIWTAGQPQAQVQIRELRRALLTDAEIESLRSNLNGLDWQAFENRTVNVPFGAQHGDLHGDNILVGDMGEPVLIDFSRVGRAPTCLDPLTIEMSLLFHRTGKVISAGWPTEQNLLHWDDVNAFAHNSTAAEVIVQLRQWASDNAQGRRALYATAYGLAVRQLKYADTDKSFVSKIVESILAAMSKT